MVAPLEGDIGLVPMGARGIGLQTPPHVLAMRALDAISAPFGTRRGGAIVLGGAIAQLTRYVLSSAGGRAPSLRDVHWTAPGRGESAITQLPVITLACEADASPASLPDNTLRALEVAELSRDADAAAFAGDLDAARLRYLEVLERAPRHPELCERVAWIDAVTDGRAEAALSLLVEATPAVFAGILGGKLLAAVKDPSGARAAYVRAAETEPYGPLATLTWLMAEPVATSKADRLLMLDNAVARAPSHRSAHVRRLAARLDAGDARGARADVEHLEALAIGARERLTICRDAADAFLRGGYAMVANDLYERALRYAPEDAAAVFGLGRSLYAAGQHRRALDLYARASSLAIHRGALLPGAELEMARGLADVTANRPAAIARVRAIPDAANEAFAARFLEGLWRSELGDATGAALAFGRLRHVVESAAGTLVSPGAEEVARMLAQAAVILETSVNDLAATERCLALALGLSPRDREIQTSFRRVAALVAQHAAPVALPPIHHDPEPASAPPAPQIAPHPEHHEESVEDLEARALSLTNRVRANPGDHADSDGARGDSRAARARYGAAGAVVGADGRRGCGGAGGGGADASTGAASNGEDGAGRRARGGGGALREFGELSGVGGTRGGGDHEAACREPRAHSEGGD